MRAESKRKGKKCFSCTRLLFSSKTGANHASSIFLLLTMGGGGRGREKQTPELFEYCRLHLGSEYRHQRAMLVPGSGCHWGLPVVLLFSLQNPRMAWAGMP